jgi:hypothetical protein
MAPPVHKTHEYVRYDFSEAEMLRMGRDLARATERIASLEAEKNDIVTAIKARITAATSEAAGLSLALNKGYEMRNVDCTVSFHVPGNGKKTTARVDTGEVIRVEAMDADEMQEQLPLSEEG